MRQVTVGVAVRARVRLSLGILNRPVIFRAAAQYEAGPERGHNPHPCGHSRLLPHAESQHSKKDARHRTPLGWCVYVYIYIPSAGSLKPSRPVSTWPASCCRKVGSDSTSMVKSYQPSDDAR